MGDTTTATAVATIIATAITALAGYLTKKSSDKAAGRNALTLSRTDLEREAFVRAEGIYKAAIDQLEREQADDRREIADLKKHSAEQDREIRDLRTELNIAKRTIRRISGQHDT